MTQQELEMQLRLTLADGRLSKEERRDLGLLFDGLVSQPELLSFARNKAFELARERSRDGQLDTEVVIWLERVIQTLDRARLQVQPVTSGAWFSPGRDCLEAIIGLIEQTRTQLDICVFTLSDDRLTQAVLAAHNKGVAVRVLSDQDKANDRGSDVDYLSRKGVEVLLDTSPYHMHHKFALFDRRWLLNGSFNWTRSASQYNQENLLLTDNEPLVSAYVGEFNRLWQLHHEGVFHAQ